MSIHPPAWHDRQLAHLRKALAEADKRHTPEEIAAAWKALHVPPRRMIKRRVMHAFLRGRVPSLFVTTIFRLLRLRSL